ncbi:MAG: GntR family transcriptional regulator [Anaerolineae bacterium]|nr:GntR family transcriptional regulator [Anaerolineae bacterium]
MVAERLRTLITQGKFPAGEWLRQERLAAELGTSYTPIREALKQLEVEGLVEHVPYRGVRVVKFSAEDVLDIYTMRSVLEGLATASAAQRMTAEQLAELRSLHAQMLVNTGPENIDLMRDLNRRFHLLIIEASGRTYLVRTLRTIWKWFPTMLWSQFSQTSSEASLERDAADNIEHEAILQALEAHDSTAAEHLMRAHIEQASQALINYLEDDNAR